MKHTKGGRLNIRKSQEVILVHYLLHKMGIRYKMGGFLLTLMILSFILFNDIVIFIKRKSHEVPDIK
jgi:hypothetical protein